ncbi:unnamed protein product [Victoria cruziana]
MFLDLWFTELTVLGVLGSSSGPGVERSITRVVSEQVMEVVAPEQTCKIKMSQRGRPRKKTAPAPEPPREPAREDTEMAQTLQTLVASVQVLSNTMQAFMERQQPPQPQNEVPIQEARAVPPLPPVAPGEVSMRPVEPLPPAVVSAEPAEITAVTPTALQHKAFMGAKPPRFSGREGPDRAEE